MGFFDLKVTCSICNKETGLNRYQIANKGWICKDCFKKCGFNLATPIKKMTVEDIMNALDKNDENKRNFEQFNATKIIGNFEIDDNSKKWIINNKGLFSKNVVPKIFNYSDIVDFELLEDGESIAKGGLGRAVVGGVLFGGIGAVVGGITGKKKSKPVCNSLKIKITLNDINNSEEDKFMEVILKKEDKKETNEIFEFIKSLNPEEQKAFKYVIDGFKIARAIGNGKVVN